MENKYFIVINSKSKKHGDEYGWVLVHSKGFKKTDKKIELENELGMVEDNDIYKLKDVAEISKEDYDEIMSTHYLENDKSTEEVTTKILDKMNIKFI